MAVDKLIDVIYVSFAWYQYTGKQWLIICQIDLKNEDPYITFISNIVPSK